MNLPFSTSFHMGLDVWVGIGISLMILTGIFTQMVRSKMVQGDTEGLSGIAIVWLLLFILTFVVVIIVIGQIMQR